MMSFMMRLKTPNLTLNSLKQLHSHYKIKIKKCPYHTTEIQRERGYYMFGQISWPEFFKCLTGICIVIHRGFDKIP